MSRAPLGRAARNAVSWIADYAYAVYWQTQGFLFRIHPDHYSGHAVTRRPVLLVPGVYESWQFLRPLADLMRERGHSIHVVPELRRNTATIRESADLVAAYLEENDLRDVLMVAHSKGGLIGKQVLLLPRTGDRIARLLAISTPFSGSVYARYFLVRAIRDFSPGDRTLVALAEQRSVNSRITSIWGAFDLHIPGGSRLDGATNVPLRTSGHFRILGQRELLDAVAAAADETDQSQRLPS